jgi:curli biogenesis system outer membrane secretion channel CsgG
MLRDRHSCVKLPLVLATVLASLASEGNGAQAKPTSVAIAATTRSGAGRAKKNLTEKLLPLVELEIAGRQEFHVVERTQIDAALRELVLNRALQSDPATHLQLNRIRSADLILLLQMLPPDKAGRQYFEARAVESLTGAIRGATVVPISDATIEDAAAEVAHYLATIIHSPTTAGVSIAVSPFECVGPFDRSRALEFGIPDLIVARLLKAERFRVLQRTNMTQLMDEVDLIRSGLADKKHLPETLPSRSAAYFLQGTIAERHATSGRSKPAPDIEITGKLIHADSKKEVLQFHFVAARNDLLNQLGAQVKRITEYLTKKSGATNGSGKAALSDETQQLFELAIRDISRLVWQGPEGYGYLPFTIPGYTVPRDKYRPNLFTIDALAQHLLKKSIDRLETILYIDPDRIDAAYALAYCYSFHVDNSWQPERAEELYRGVFEHDPNAKIARSALDQFAKMYFHHDGNMEIEKENLQPAIRCCLFAMMNWPLEHRDHSWAELLSRLQWLYGQTSDYTTLASTVHTAAKLAEESDPTAQADMANQVSFAAVSYIRRPANNAELKSAMRQLLSSWSESNKPPLRCHGSQGLARLAEFEKNPVEAAKWFRRAADALNTPADNLQERTRTRLMTEAARNFRKAGVPTTGIEALQSISPKNHPTHFEYGFYGYELGQCFVEAGNHKQALETYVKFAEEGFGLCWNTDITDRITRLGGVPLRNDCDIDVKYIDDADGKPFYCRSVATDGRRLFCGGGYRKEYVNSEPISGIRVYDIDQHQWRPLDGPPDRVSCLACERGQLWAGTDHQGLWRCNLATEAWTHWSTDDGLPASTITAIAVRDRTALVGLGNRDKETKDITAGGLVRIDSDDAVKIYEKGDAPIVAPEYVVLDKDAAYAASNANLYELDRNADKWRKVPRTVCLSLFQTDSGLWLSRCHMEVFRWGANAEENKLYSRAWYPTMEHCHQIRFLFQRGDNLWFGGGPWRAFYSHGFYRLNTRTGDFRIYGARDGFRIGRTPDYDCYAGLWVANRIWLATSFGLAEITLH